MREFCRYAGECPVCAGPLDSALLRHLRLSYCVDGWQECARFAALSEVGLARVPSDLRPTDHTRAYEIVARHWRSHGSSAATAVFGGVT